MGRGRSSFSLMLLVIAASVLIARAQNRASGSADGADSSSRPEEDCPAAMRKACTESTASQRTRREAALSSASVCVDVGYLCAELERTNSMWIRRWPADTGRLRVRVPLPPGVPPGRARALQSAVVRGLQYWQRRPFELIIDTHPTPSGEVDIEITWGQELSGLQLGLTRTRWTFERGVARFEVLGIALAVNHPSNSNYQITPPEILLTSAHEMGHALGLPHSDSERDVMYPTNTARNLSTRDFRTLAALYRLPNGVLIARDL